MDIESLMNNKLHMYNLLSKDSRLAQYLPETVPFSEKNLASFFKQYQTVVLKPTDSHSGTGVMKIEHLENGTFEVHKGVNKTLFQDLKSTVNYLQSSISSTPYLTQQYIPLLDMGKVPFDIRVIIQRVVGLSWNVTARFARLAKESSFITTSGKKRVYVSYALKESDLDEKRKEQLLMEINFVSLFIGNCLSKHFKHYIYGIDLGIDRNGEIYIIEVNYKPYLNGIKGFNMKMYKLIQSYLLLNGNR